MAHAYSVNEYCRYKERYPGGIWCYPFQILMRFWFGFFNPGLKAFGFAYCYETFEEKKQFQALVLSNDIMQ